MQLTPASHHRIIFLGIIQLKLRYLLLLSFRSHHFLFRNMIQLCNLIHVLTIHDLKPNLLLLLERRGGVYDFKGFSSNAVLLLGVLDTAEELVLFVLGLLEDEGAV